MVLGTLFAANRSLFRAKIDLRSPAFLTNGENACTMDFDMRCGTIFQLLRRIFGIFVA
jgi:hypothetical protein